MSAGDFRTYQFRLSQAKLDVRSEPADMSSQSLRWILNAEMGKTGRLHRRRGWTRLLHAANYNNQDLHDQLLPLQTYYENLDPKAADADKVIAWPSSLCAGQELVRENGREVISLIRDVVATNGSRRLVTATRSRIYELNEATGNYRLLGDGFSGQTNSTAKRWQCDQAKNFVCFTNDFDVPMYYEIGNDAIAGCAKSALKPMPTLDTIKLSKAGMLCVWKNVIFLGNVELDYGRLENKIVWSDLVRRDSATSKEEISFTHGDADLAEGTVAGDADLYYGHKVLRMVPMGNIAMIYTTRGIWRVTATGESPANGGSAFAFEPIYESPSGDKCLAYPGAIASTGEAHYFLSREGYLYKMDAFNLTPQRLDWLADAGDIIPRTLDQTICDWHIMGYDATVGEVHVSWVQQGEELPSMSFAFTPESEWGTYIDAGFTAYGSFTSDPRLTFRDFLRNLGICTTEEVGGLFTKEGLPADVPTPSGLTCIYTTQTKIEDGIETEDWDAPVADDNSLCRYLELIGQTRADDFCQECNETLLFIGASSVDWCLKQLNTGYSREHCSNPTATGSLTDLGYLSAVGTYTQAGYTTRFVTGPMVIFDDPTQSKLVSFMELESEVELNALSDPAKVGLRLGTSYQALDTTPFNAACMAIWGTSVNRSFTCPLKMTPAHYHNNNLSPAFTIDGPFHKLGRYIYAHIAVGAEESGEIVDGIGGGGAFSNFRLKVKPLRR